MLSRLNWDGNFSLVSTTPQRTPSSCSCAKEAAARETASRWINVKAYDPNKRIISKIYCAASRVVNSARAVLSRKRRKVREGRRWREENERKRAKERSRRVPRVPMTSGKKVGGGKRKRDQAASKLRWLWPASFRLVPVVMPCKLY